MAKKQLFPIPVVGGIPASLVPQGTAGTAPGKSKPVLVPTVRKPGRIGNPVEFLLGPMREFGAAPHTLAQHPRRVFRKFNGAPRAFGMTQLKSQHHHHAPRPPLAVRPPQGRKPGP